MGKPTKGISAINFTKDLKKFEALAKDSDPELRKAGQAVVALAKRLKKLDIAEKNGKLDKSELPKAYKWQPMVARYQKLQRHLSLLLSKKSDPLFRFAKANLVKAVAKLAGDVIPKVAATSATWKDLGRLGVWVDVSSKNVVLRAKHQAGPFLRRIADEENLIGHPADVMSFGSSKIVVDVEKPITGVSVTKKGKKFIFLVTTSDGAKHVRSLQFKAWTKDDEVIPASKCAVDSGLLILGIL